MRRKTYPNCDPGNARELERIERLFLDGPPHSPPVYDNPDTIVARGKDGGLVEISLVDPLPEILEIVLNKTPAERRELLEQLKS